MNGFTTIVLPDTRFRNPKITRVIPRIGEPLGILAGIRGSEWEALLPKIPARDLERAILGDARPLMQQIGPPPRVLALRVSPEGGACAYRGGCMLAGPDCKPGPKVPDCWVSEAFPGMDGALSYVVAQWKRDIPVIVVV